MIKEMTNIAAECLKNPRRKSTWSPRQNKYVCPEGAKRKRPVAARDDLPAEEAIQHPPLTPLFKLVFITAASGTLLFVLCFGCSMAAGKEPHPLLEKLIMGFFDLAKIGFGVIVVLLGGRTLVGERRRS